MKSEYIKYIFCAAIVAVLCVALVCCSTDKNIGSDANSSVQNQLQNDDASQDGDSFEVLSDAGQTDALPRNDAFMSDGSKQPGEYNVILSEAFAGYDGTLSTSLHIYKNGVRAGSGSGKQKAASVIKLFVMDCVYNLITAGEMSVDDVIGGKSVKSLVESMITVSDNNATNTLIDALGMDKINAHIKACGYKDTVLGRKMLDTAAAQRGEENYTSSADVMKFLDILYDNRETFPQSEMIDVMKRQQISTKLRRNMPPDAEIASKTGELSDTENDVAIVFSEGGDYALVCLAQGGNISVAKEAMGPLCKTIYDMMNG